MSIPSRPRTTLHEGPANSCVIDGKAIGWLNCSPTSVAMGISKTTLGAKNPTGCNVRGETGDTVGGTSIPQVAAAAKSGWGVTLEVRVGSNVCSPAYGATKLRGGHGIALQGNCGVLVGTPFRSTGGKVNHCIYLNEGRNWRADGTPTEVLVYDPAADGRTAGWGKSAVSPAWWPWSLVLKFAAALQPWGDNDSRTLGSGKWYCGIFPSSEPHVHLRFTGSVRTSPFPRPLTIVSPVKGKLVNIRSGPSTSYPVKQRLGTASKFIAFQQNPRGQSLSGSRLWYGSHDGNLWVHSSGVR